MAQDSLNDTTQKRTEAAARRWFDALTSGDIATMSDCLADDVEWINYKPLAGYNDIMPWIGTFHGPQEVLDSFQVFIGLVEPQVEELVTLIVDGDVAAGVVHERSKVKATGQEFEIEFVQWLTIRDGKIARWKSYTDPSPIIKAMGGGPG